MAKVKYLLFSLITSFIFTTHINASEIDETSDREAARIALKKLRKHPTSFNFADLKVVLDASKESRSLQKIPVKQKTDESLVHSHYRHDNFIYTVLFHQSWDEIIKSDFLNSYYIRLKSLPTFNLVKLQTRLEFELGLDEARLCDFQIMYIRSSAKGISKTIPGVKPLMKHQRTQAVEKFMEKRPTLYKDTIGKAESTLAQAQVKAAQVKRVISGQYESGREIPLPSPENNKRRAFAIKRMQSASVLPRTVGKLAMTESEEKEKKDPRDRQRKSDEKKRVPSFQPRTILNAEVAQDDSEKKEIKQEYEEKDVSDLKSS